MNFKTFFTVTALSLTQFAAPALACDPRSLNESTGGTPPITWGPDTPSDPATVGYHINHFSLNVVNLTATIDFYTSVLGIRHIFTMQPSEHLFIAYLGHAQGGRNGTGYQTTEEINREKNNADGLIELIFLDVDNDLPPSSEKSNTFGHIGLVVPDIEAAQARLDAMDNVEILKRTGDDTPSTGKIANANGFSKEAWGQIDEEEQAVIQGVLDAVNLRFIYVSDPEGNIVEIQPQD